MENITVCTRIKPKTNNQLKDDDNLWKVEGNSIISGKSKEVFSFDKVILPYETNEELFKSTVKEYVDKFINAINVSIFAYGQTSTGKTHTMKGSNLKLNGIIPLSIQEIISKLSEEEKKWNNGAFKSTIKISYVEIYNETINDLLEPNKKNLEIRESLQRGVFINNLTEVTIQSYDKAMALLKQGDSQRVTAETKLNEKSSRSHTLFKINLEVTKVIDGKQKIFQSQLNLVDLAGSENVSKAKTEGIRMKEGSNINKSLLALSNVIQKLSNNPKTFVNYRDSKLTRLLQPSLSGNSKTMIICTITESSANYSETVNTLHFGIKAKNIKTTIKINEVVDEKSKIIQENTQLKSKIKQLEDMISEKKQVEDKEKDTRAINQNNDMISVLEKEVSLLKRILISNEEIGESDVNSVTAENKSVTSNNNFMGNAPSSTYNNYNHLNNGLMSATKYNRTSILMSSGKKMTDSARKIYKREDIPSMQNLNTNLNFNDPSESAYRRGNMTEMKMNSYNVPSYNQRDSTMMNMTMNMNMPTSHAPSYSNYILNTAQKKYTASASANLMNNNFNLSAMKPQSQFNFEGDNDFLYPGQNDNSFQLLKENDELRKNIYELRKNFFETVQNKDNQIKSLNFYLTTTNENCEKIIREAEENYMNLKISTDRAKEDTLNKDIEIKNLNQTIRNLEANSNYYKEEINNLNNEMNKLADGIKGDKMYKELDLKYNDLLRNYETLQTTNDFEKSKIKEYLTSVEKLSNDNEKLKMALDNYKSENLSFKTQYDVMKKTSDLLTNENGKIKNDIESYKNEIASNKDKLNKLRAEINQLTKKGGKETAATKNEEYENKIASLNAYISKLETQIGEYKNNLIKIEQTQIAEYQKLLDESFAKIAEMQSELQMGQQKILYLEKIIGLNVENNKTKLQNSIRQTPVLKDTYSENKNNISQFCFNEKTVPAFNTPLLGLKEDELENENNQDSLVSSAGKDFIGKKRKHLNKVYQNMIDKNLNTKIENVNRTPRTDN